MLRAVWNGAVPGGSGGGLAGRIRVSLHRIGARQ
jgi:hypothetical protein